MTLIPKFMGRDDELSTTDSCDDRSVDSWTVTQKILAQIQQVFEDRGARAWSRRSRSAYGMAKPVRRKIRSRGSATYPLQHRQSAHTLRGQPNSRSLGFLAEC